MESSAWKKDGDHTYYLTENGSAMTGWMKLGDDTYYFDADGHHAYRKATGRF